MPKIETSKASPCKPSPCKPSLDLQQPDIKPNIPVTGFKLSDSQDSEFTDLLIERLKGLILNMLHTDSESEGEPQYPSQSQTNTDTEQHIQNIEASFHKIEYEPFGLKTYYKRPTPQDLLFEEDSFQNQVSYNSRTIYEWNIDGLSEYQIYEVIHKMLIYATIYKASGNNDSNVAKFIANGFTGSLKGW